MSAGVYCDRCSENPLRKLGIDMPDEPLQHCYGDGDQPGTPGLIGSGTFCPCECRTWPHQPHDLYTLAAKEHPGDLNAIRRRYRELMIKHGHLIPGTPKPLPCGWPSLGGTTEEGA